MRYRFPGGESYQDVIERVEPIVIDLEQTTSPVLIVTHLSVIRILCAYFKVSCSLFLFDYVFYRVFLLKSLSIQLSHKAKSMNLHQGFNNL